jgi:ubiquitin fusion degradation protein 1
MNVEYPMLFQLNNRSMNRTTHCGVYEFSAPEGCCYLPFWMMQNLMLGEGATIIVKNVSLPKAKFVKFRPQSVDFLDISNPRAVLEKTLRNYTCVSQGDIICIHYLNKNLYLEVVEVKPGTAASIVETDCEVDFDEPVGYVQPVKAPTPVAGPSSAPSGSSSTTPRQLQKARAADEQTQQEEESKKFKAFTGKAMRVDGRVASASPSSASTPSSVASTSPATSNQTSAASAAGAAALSRQSLVGNKYSTKKVAVSAFNGKASTLSGPK